MQLWQTFVVLEAVLGTRLDEEGGGCTREIQRQAQREASNSPWFKEEWQKTAGYLVEYKGILGTDCVGMSGYPSKLKFTKLGENTSEPINETAGLTGLVSGLVSRLGPAVGSAGPEPSPEQAAGGGAARPPSAHYSKTFYAVFKMTNPTEAGEADLTRLAAANNGLSVQLIQGARASGTEHEYVLTEFLPGTDLNFLDRVSFFFVEPYLFRMIAAQLFYVLMMLKQNMIIHRDIKFANFRLTPAGCDQAFLGRKEGHERRRIFIEKGCRIVLIDFGLGCTSDIEEVQKLKRRIGCYRQAAGSPGWASPEIIKTDGFFSSKTDVFSAGVLLYLGLKGKFPQMVAAAKGKKVIRNQEDLLAATTSYALGQDLSKPPSGVPPSMAASVQAMLNPSPEQRPEPHDLFYSDWLNFQPEHAPEMADKGAEHYRTVAESVANDVLGERENFNKEHHLPPPPPSQVVLQATPEQLAAHVEMMQQWDRYEEPTGGCGRKACMAPAKAIWKAMTGAS